MELTTRDFFEAIFKEHLATYGGYIELRDIEKAGGKVIASFYKSIDEALLYLPKHNLYFGVCPRENNKGGKDNNIKYIPALWADIDIGEDKPFKTKEEALESLNKFEFNPSAIVDSGNGLHTYWFLKKTEPKDKNIKGILKGLAKTLKGDEKPCNPAWVLRVPNTTNLKNPKNPKEVKILKMDSTLRYDLKDFAKFIVPVSDVKALAISFSGEVKDINIDSLKIEPHLKKLIQTHVPKGKRSEKDFAIICGLVEAGYDDNVIVSIFLKNPIGDKVREQGIQYLTYSIGKARGGIEGKNKLEVQKTDFVKHRAGGLIYEKVAQKILSEHSLIYSASSFYEYMNGYYQKIEDEVVNRWILEILANDFSIRTSDEVIHCLHTICYVKTDDLNNTDKLNLKNGLFSLDTYTLSEHTPEMYSTIQLNVEYRQEALATKWIKTLNEIFLEDQFKIKILQEFVGLCLTRDTTFNRALFCIGDGANGKSVILNTIEKVLGTENYSTIPVEKFGDGHYIVSIFGKLVNISTESEAKTEVYDSIFKSVTSGDSITANPKFKPPFSFHPFCKLIFALNNMPRVEDKTVSYFRRLLILRFDRQFKIEEQNRKLSQELLVELDGIFNWALEGLARLRERGRFEENEKMRKEIADYQKENNNVIVFVEEECILNPPIGNNAISKKALYHKYQGWSKENGYRPLSMGKFGKELRKHFPSIGNETHRNERVWVNIDSYFISQKDLSGVP